MSTKYESCADAPDDGEDTTGATHIRGQSFTPSVAHTITSVKFTAYKYGTPGANTLHIEIKATDGAGKPTGAVLASGTMDGNTITTNTAGVQYEVTLGAGTLLSASTKYAWLGYLENTAGLGVVFRSKDVGTYTGGKWLRSDDTGATWTVAATENLLFEDWGNPVTSTPASKMIRLGYVQGVESYGGVLPNIKLQQCTHVVFAHSGVVSAANPTITCSWGFGSVTDTIAAAHAVGKKGGADIYFASGGTVGKDIVANSGHLATFAANVAAYVTTYSMDCFVLDWEETFTNAEMLTMATALYNAIHPLGCDFIIYSAAVVLPNSIASYCDYLEVIYPAAILDPATRYTDYIGGLAAMYAAGWPKSKLLLMAEFYAFDANGSNGTYKNVVDEPLNPYDSTANVATLNGVTVVGGTIGWNGINLMTSWVDYIKANGYGGMVFWSLGQDKLQSNLSLLQNIYYEDVGWPNRQALSRNLIGALG